MLNTDPVLILTRPQRQSERFLSEIEGKIGQTVQHLITPLLRIELTQDTFEIDPNDILIFTSENAVLACNQTVQGHRAYCVGQRTALAAEKKGCTAINTDGDASDLITKILADAPNASLLHLRGHHTRGDICKILTNQGMSVREQVIYHQQENLLDLNMLNSIPEAQPLIFPVFSPRTADILAEHISVLSHRVHIVAISDATSSPLQTLQHQGITIAKAPNGPAMIEAVAQLWCDRKNG